ncbi:DUF6783 domain-containing protein [Blautia sp.]
MASSDLTVILFLSIVCISDYDNRIRAKYTAKCALQIAGMIFQTRSITDCCV